MAVFPAQVVVESNITYRILFSVAFVLLYYDFLLTFRQEVERYWTGTFSLASFLFFMNRYLSLLGHIPVIFGLFYSSTNSPCTGIERMHMARCQALQLYHFLLSIAVQSVVAALMLLRTYALYERSHRVLALLLAIIGIGAPLCVWGLVAGRHTGTFRQATFFVSAGADHSPRVFCDLTSSQREGYDLAIAWGAISAFDATVFVLTLLKALETGRTWSGGYFRVMLRDGTIYFAFLFLCYLSNILPYALGQPVHKGVSTSVTNAVSSTLISRLMLNIRDPDLRQGPACRWGRRSIDSCSDTVVLTA
ncbi:hypothetical protein BC628DRAFT_1416450 [Trametes gibbosa]|nr:hypothetical protein BC628DRAFT_1416450 [Trametes gibbosa]